jgi:L-xylulokinase
MAAAPSAVITWLREREPEALVQARWLMSSTDWLRFKLTGNAATDHTMASAAFVSLGSPGEWSLEALALCGADDLAGKLPPILGSTDVAGHITAEASRLTGLPVGAAVVAGAHDVDTGALGLGASTPGDASVLLGTYAINQVLGHAPVPDPRWQTRPFVTPGSWLHMSTSPAGAGCLDWAAARMGPWDGDGAPDSAAAVVEAQSVDPSAQPYFLPFVHGGPSGHPVGGGWLGLRSEHGRASMLFAVMEGVAFSHCSHLGALASRMPLPPRLRVGGGGARSRWWTQLLADAVGADLEVTKAQEVSALGAALLAGVGVGVYDSVDLAASSAVRVGRSHHPDPRRHAELSLRYARYRAAVDALKGLDLGPGDQGARSHA